MIVINSVHLFILAEIQTPKPGLEMLHNCSFPVLSDLCLYPAPSVTVHTLIMFMFRLLSTIYVQVPFLIIICPSYLNNTFFSIVICMVLHDFPVLPMRFSCIWCTFYSLQALTLYVLFLLALLWILLPSPLLPILFPQFCL